MNIYIMDKSIVKQNHLFTEKENYSSSLKIKNTLKDGLILKSMIRIYFQNFNLKVLLQIHLNRLE
jgi:hypothetical protein